jgi:hypothetical protein
LPTHPPPVKEFAVDIIDIIDIIDITKSAFLSYLFLPFSRGL